MKLKEYYQTYYRHGAYACYNLLPQKKMLVKSKDFQSIQKMLSKNKHIYILVQRMKELLPEIEQKRIVFVYDDIKNADYV